MSDRIEINVPAGTARTRLEEFLFDQFPGLSRMYLRRIVRDEMCEVNGRLENVGYRVRGGDFLEVALDLSRENSMRPEDVPVDIVFEDEHLAVVNKPAGMLVHPTNRDKSGTLLNALTFHLNQNTAAALIRPGLVHRLDKQTSGLIVIAKTARIHRILARQFQRKIVEKKYLALVEGILKNDEGMIDAPIGRYDELKQWSVKSDGKHSTSRYWVKKRFKDTTLIELEPITGRTNQLRIHCEHIGHGIVGDTKRGGREFSRLCLHAYKLTFPHPSTHEKMVFETDQFVFPGP